MSTTNNINNTNATNNTMDYAKVSKMLIETEYAVKKLKEYQAPQIQSTKDNIVEQVCDYIQYTLNEANWQFKSAEYYKSISLLPSPNWHNCVVLYLLDNTAIGTMVPIVNIFPDKIKFIDYPITDNMILTLVKYWGYFKCSLHNEIKRYMEEKQKKLNKEIQQMAAFQDAINKFEL